MNALRSWSLRQQAEWTVNEHYSALEREVLGVVGRRLSARNMRLDSSDLEEAYCQAWHGVCEQISQGVKVVNLTGMLVEITWRRAVDGYREMRPGQRVDVDVDTHGVEVDVDERLDDQAKLQRLITRAKGRLSREECEAVGLCLIHGRKHYRCLPKAIPARQTVIPSSDARQRRADKGGLRHGAHHPLTACIAGSGARQWRVST